MSKILAITGATGPKSGFAFLNQVIKNKEKIDEMFPDGIRLLIRNSKK